MSAFLLIANKGHFHFSARRFDPMQSREALGFAASQCVTWSDRRRRLAAWVWSEGDVGETAGDRADLLLRCGNRRWRGTAPGVECDDLVALLEGPSPGEAIHRDLRGVGIVGRVSSGGDGWLIPDPLGLRCLYYGESDRIHAFGSRASLVAQALAGGSHPPKDLEAICWLTHTSYWASDSTGFRGVRVAQPGSALCLRRGRPHWETISRLTPKRGRPRRSVEDVADAVTADVARSLRALLDRPADRHIIQLTGGKDSRLILAIALQAGLAHQFEYETTGPPQLADVQIAGELTEALGLRHETRFFGMRSKEPYAGARIRLASETAGMVNAWDVFSPVEGDDVRVTGICGELLRAFRKVPQSRRTDGRMAADVFRRDLFGRLGLLRPDVAEAFHHSLLSRVGGEEPNRVDPLDELHLYFATNRMRFVHAGPLEELAGNRPFLPLYSLSTARAAMDLGSLDRQSEILFAEIMRRGSELLVEHRFTDAGWDTRATAHLERQGFTLAPRSSTAAYAITDTQPPRSPEPPVRSPRPEPSAVGAQSLMQMLNDSLSDERTDFLATVFSDGENPIWDLLDRTRAIVALGDWTRLSNPERRELFGAATAATWAATTA